MRRERKETLYRGFMEFVLSAPFVGAEMVRRTLTCGHETTYNRACEPLHFDNHVAEGLLYHSGNFADGLFYTFLMNNTLGFIFPGLPEKYRLWGAIAATNAILAYHERGDPWDIPAGLLGTAAYLGINRIFGGELAKEVVKKEILDAQN